MKDLGATLEKVGTTLAVLGGLCFAGIFLIVIVNGTWPDFLEPVRRRYGMISDFAGGFAFVIELFLFIGPGLLIAALGQKLQNSN